jgi:hypothetical protein
MLYVCQVSETAADVVPGHWQAKASCHEALAKAETEKVAKPVAEVEMPIAQTDTTEETPIAPEPIAPAATKTAPTAPSAIGTNDEPPNRGDNGRGRLQPIPVKKVSTVQISSKNSDEPIAASKN